MPATGYVVPDLDDGRPVRRKGSSNAHDLVDESTPLSALRRKPPRGLWSPAHRSNGDKPADPETASTVDDEAPMAIDLTSKPLTNDDPTPSDDPASTPQETTDAPTTTIHPTTEAPEPTEPATAAPTLRPTEAHTPTETLSATTPPPAPTALATSVAASVGSSTSTPPPQPSLRRPTLGIPCETYKVAT
ncbi:hypothetical protein SPRG_12237 [Saprolegnia parasitica CBS 223.65]|uniref:Uncharacterized protein n=1 Tax=Saprolegnia parasitica (strain CBS 223.65) TaxID=695850 RepID=A0A067BUS3_SAPPC|nr:hypothetical protein SPRG_12237 [Saprolegnia parasitica CBS 223.65]KDO22028.1 hypothetical protein SPRG_12237 [Saprolegnia parasitica CBS 223.65]|eukprot:XP_012207271.1 hypothetical protein SPRG_12237 [Saprolegnia parasitica CBS 223.65]